MSVDQHPHEARFARVTTSSYPVLVGAFTALLVISNVGATKLVQAGPLLFDGGAILFPLVYVLGDVITEVFGFRAARRAVVLGFAMSVLAALTFLLVQIAPHPEAYGNQAAFEAVLGFVPRIVVASVCGFLVGQLLNSYVLVRIKERTDEKALWLRLLGSTAVGQFADTVVFCTIAFYGVITGAEFLNYVVTGYVYKVAVEVLLLPVTYPVIAAVKRHEPTYGDVVVPDPEGPEPARRREV